MLGIRYNCCRLGLWNLQRAARCFQIQSPLTANVTFRDLVIANGAFTKDMYQQHFDRIQVQVLHFFLYSFFLLETKK